MWHKKTTETGLDLTKASRETLLAVIAELAERSLRHLVISRKISGGTRSEAGSGSKMTLASLFGAWRARGLNPFLETRRLLISPQL